MLYNQVTKYTGVYPLKWRETGQLPSPRFGLRAAFVDNVIYVSGGLQSNWADRITSILYWDPSVESWQPAGDLAVARGYHAAVAIPSYIVLESGCSAMFLT